jgi:hypothetical protein
MSWIIQVLQTKFADNTVAQTHYGDLLSAYEASGLAPPNLEKEIRAGGNRGFWTHVWEAILFRYLSDLGFQFRYDKVSKAGQNGPDFGIVYNDTTIWIEAVAPSPEGIPVDYLLPPQRGQFVARTVPHQEMLLRWTTALKDKRDKLQGYVEKGIILATEPAVVAINGSRLGDFFFDDNGISQMPVAVEATFPVGPIAVPISLDGKVAGEAARVPRYAVRKPNGTEVRTDSFLNPIYANVSAVIGCVKKDMWNALPITVVHNPLANIGLPRGILAARKEYVADEKGDEYLLRPLNKAAPKGGEGEP